MMVGCMIKIAALISIRARIKLYDSASLFLKDMFLVFS